MNVLNKIFEKLEDYNNRHFSNPNCISLTANDYKELFKYSGSMGCHPVFKWMQQRPLWSEEQVAGLHVISHNSDVTALGVLK